MKVSRRRFLAICGAACAARPASARTVWRGRAFGAEASIALVGEGAEHALSAAFDTIRRMERLFSLYDPNSSLSVLNREGRLSMPPEFGALIKVVEEMHSLTGGLFDPTVQPLWTALANGEDADAARRRLGWNKVRVEGSDIEFGEPGMALTLNGIAQGFATDRVKAVLVAHGFRDVVVNVGEYAVGLDTAKIAVADARGRLIEAVELRDEAIATSSALALEVGGRGHILHPLRDGHVPMWETVSVTARSAAIADALSTAISLSLDERLASRIVTEGSAHRVVLKSRQGP